MSYFEQLGLAESLLRALNSKGYAEPTPIQREAIPALLDGRDLLGIAQTGTGKTAAFSLPSLHRLAQNPTGRFPAGCRMLVLSPTRELAAQIADNMRQYSRFLDLSVQCVFGGMPVRQQARKLTNGCDILVATPGRLLDLIEQRALTLQHVEIFVLDEADQMMDLGFIKPLTRISAMLPDERQSLFFSATMPSAIASLGKRFIRNPVRVEVAPQSTTAERVDQFVTFLDQKEKQALLTITLRQGLENGEIESALVFTRTKHGADRVVRHLVAANINAAAIHGNKTQAQRTRALDGFRRRSIPVLVATDIAARGIDVPGVSAVFNFEIPNIPEQYVHRIGRTARAGASGLALSFVARDEKGYIRDIEKLTGVKLARRDLPENFIELAKQLPAPAQRGTGAERSDEDRSSRFRKGKGGDRGRDSRGRGSSGFGGRGGGGSGGGRSRTYNAESRDGFRQDSYETFDRGRDGGNRENVKGYKKTRTDIIVRKGEEKGHRGAASGGSNDNQGRRNGAHEAPRHDRGERGERYDRGARHDRGERYDRGARNDRGERGEGGERGERSRNHTKRQWDDRGGSYDNRSRGEGSRGGGSRGDRPRGDRPRGDRPRGDRPRGGGSGEVRSGGGRYDGGRSAGGRSGGGRSDGPRHSSSDRRPNRSAEYRDGGRPQRSSASYESRSGGSSRSDHRSGPRSGPRSDGRSEGRSEGRSGGRSDGRSGGRSDGRSERSYGRQSEFSSGGSSRPSRSKDNNSAKRGGHSSANTGSRGDTRPSNHSAKSGPGAKKNAMGGKRKPNNQSKSNNSGHAPLRRKS